MRARHRGLLVGRDRADHGGAEMLRPLAQDQADAAGRRMHQDRVAGLHGIGVAQEIARGHAADHHRRRRALVDAVRQLHHARRRHVARLRIGAVRPGHAGDAVADRDVRHAGPDRLDHAGALEPDAGGKRAHLVDAAADQHVAIIDRDRRVPHAHLTGGGRREVHVLPLHHLRSAVLVEAERLAHRCPRCARNLRAGSLTASNANGLRPRLAALAQVRAVSIVRSSFTSPHFT